MLTQCVIEKENIEEVARVVDQDAVVANEDTVDSAYHILKPNEADDMGLNNGITQDLTLSHTSEKGGKENEQSTEVFTEVATNLDTYLSDDRIGSKDNFPEHENIQHCNIEAQVLPPEEKGDDHGNSSNVESDSHIVDINKKAVTHDQHDFNQKLQIPYGVKTFLHADTPKLVIQLERVDDNSSKKVNTKSSAVDEMCFSNRKFTPKTRGHKMEKDTTPQKKETVSLIVTSIRKLNVLGEPNEMKDRPKDEKNRIKGHTGELICHICRKSFTCASKLQEHILMHTGEKHCLCCKCGKRFKNRSGNTIHRMRCGGKVVYNAWFKRLIKGNQCQVCNRQFKFLSQLLVHYGVHNSEGYMKFKPQVKKQNVDARQTKGSMAIVNKRLSNSKGKNPVSIPKEGKKREFRK